MWGSNCYDKKSSLFEMTMVVLGVLSSRLSLNVINIVVVVDNCKAIIICILVAYKATVLYQCLI